MDEAQILKDKYDKLPEDIKKSIMSVDLSSKLQDVIKRNKLLINQAGELETEVSLVLFGIVRLSNFLDNLMKNLQLPREKALVIAHDVDELIFKNIRESLRKMGDDAEKADAVVTSPLPEPTRDEILGVIENSATVASKEGSVSLSSLKSNSPKLEYPSETLTKGVEIRKEKSLEIPPEAMLPAIQKNQPETISILTEKKAEPYHQNISPVDNIVETKMNNTIIIPKEKIFVEEKTKLPEKPVIQVAPVSPVANGGGKDPYREPII